MPPKKIIASASMPAAVRARAVSKPAGVPRGKGGQTEQLKREIQALKSMTAAEFYPYVCLLLAFAIYIVYGYFPSLLGRIVETQYPVEGESEGGGLYHVGPADLPQLIFLYLCIVSFITFSVELLEMLGKFVLKLSSPRKVQEAFILHSANALTNGLLLINSLEHIPALFPLSLESIWSSFGGPMSKGLKINLLLHAAFQLHTIISYAMNAPKKSRMSLTMVGNCAGLFFTLFAYLAGYTVPLLVVLAVFDLTSFFKEIILAYKASTYPKTKQAVHKLGKIFSVLWLPLRVGIPALFALSFWMASPRTKFYSPPEDKGDHIVIPSPFTLLDFALMAGVLVVSWIQYQWNRPVARKIFTAHPSTSYDD